jgi:ParB family transcriptional regulator, chromosome partitioning protein
VKRKDALKSLLSIQPGSEAADSENSDEEKSIEAEHTPSGAVRAMGLSLQKLTADAETGRLLKQQLTQGLQVVELTPAEVDPSFITDRLAEPEDVEFAALIESIKTNGQLVPILVRPHPDQPGRFQVAYGHRRLRVAEILQLKVKAVVRDLNDEEMVIAQGKENNDRRDLSFIERAVFAQRLEDKGFNRNVLIAALSVDKHEIAKLLSVARSIPTFIVQSIGPAPKAGRPRWLALAKLVDGRGKEKKIEGILASESFRALGSDRKFEALFAALSDSPKDDRSIEHWADPKGRRIVRLERGLGHTKLFFDEKLEPNFGAHVIENLSKLYSDFKSRGGED